MFKSYELNFTFPDILWKHGILIVDTSQVVLCPNIDVYSNVLRFPLGSFIRSYSLSFRNFSFVSREERIARSFRL